MQKSYKKNYLTLIKTDKYFRPKLFGATPLFVQYNEHDVIMEYMQDNAYSFNFPLSGIHYVSLVIFSKSHDYHRTLCEYIGQGTTKCKNVIDIQFKIDESLINGAHICIKFALGIV